MRSSNFRAYARAYPFTNTRANAYAYAYAYAYARTNTYAYARVNAHFDTESKFIELNQSAEHTEPKQSIKFTADCYANTTNEHGWKHCPNSGKLCTTADCPDRCREDVRRQDTNPWPWPCVIPGANSQSNASSAKLVSRSTYWSGNAK